MTRPSVQLRAMTLEDIPRLQEIRPTYTTPTILALETSADSGAGLSALWRLVEVTPKKPFSKGDLYNFGPETQEEIRERLHSGKDAFEWVALDGDRLAGMVDAQFMNWNHTVFLWNLMVDLDYRRHGIGRQLWDLTVKYARRSGARAITLETQNTNLAACHFYLKMGCRLVGYHEVYYTNHWQDGEFALFFAYTL